MTEIYWITRLDTICIALGIAIFFSLAITIGLLFSYNVDIEDERDKKYAKKGFIVSFIVLIVCTILQIFIPTTKDMLLIYGVGGTYEWVKDNDKVKELPDKCIDALDKIVDDYLNED